MDANAKGERPRIYMSSRTHKVVVVFPNGEVVEGKETLTGSKKLMCYLYRGLAILVFFWSQLVPDWSRHIFVFLLKTNVESSGCGCLAHRQTLARGTLTHTHTHTPAGKVCLTCYTNDTISLTERNGEEKKKMKERKRKTTNTDRPNT